MSSRPSGLSVFVLEDEALIRLMITEMVEELGHRIVAEASNVQEGLSLADTADFDLALLDVNVAGQPRVGFYAVPYTKSDQ